MAFITPSCGFVLFVDGRPHRFVLARSLHVAKLGAATRYNEWGEAIPTADVDIDARTAAYRLDPMALCAACGRELEHHTPASAGGEPECRALTDRELTQMSFYIAEGRSLHVMQQRAPLLEVRRLRARIARHPNHAP